MDSLAWDADPNSDRRPSLSIAQTVEAQASGGLGALLGPILLYEIAGAATIGLGLLSIDGRLPRRAMRVMSGRLADPEMR